MFWKEPIGWPNAWRSLAYWTVSSRICLAWARLVIAEPRRSCGRNCIIEMKPVSSGPTRSALLTRTSSKDSSAVSDSSWPTLSSTRPTLKPSRVVSTAKSEMPLAFFSGLVRAATSTRSAEPPLVMKVLEPLMIQSSPSRTAVVRRLARSEPPPGSVMPIAVTSSPVARPRQPARPLLVVGEVHEVGNGDVGVDADAARQGHVDLGQLLGEHRVEAVVAGLRAAERLGDLEAEEALLAGRDPEVAVEAVVRRVRVEVRGDLAVQELLDRGAEGLVVLVVDLTLHARYVTRGSPRWWKL